MLWIVKTTAGGVRHGACEIEGSQPRLPVVAMHDVDRPAVRRLGGKARRGERQSREAQVIVAPVKSVRPEIRVPGPVVEVRGIDNDDLEPVLRARGGEGCGTAEQVVVGCDDAEPGRTRGCTPDSSAA